MFTLKTFALIFTLALWKKHSKLCCTNLELPHKQLYSHVSEGSYMCTRANLLRKVNQLIK